MAVLTPQDKGVTPGIILRLGEPPSWHGAALEVVLVPGTSERVLLEAQTLQPMGEGPLLATLEALFPMGDRVVDEPLPEEPAGPLNCNLDLDVDLVVGADEDDEYLLS